MTKRELFGVMSFAERDELIALAGKIEAGYTVTQSVNPRTTLVLLKFRESAKNTLFYAAEALACECSVRLGEARGFAARLGDDLDCVYAMAVIDAALNAGVPETGEIEAALGDWAARIREVRATQARLVMSTKVDFSIMEE
ncbi:MAG: phosphonate C-P lyase system protein PhnG [Oscillospiraceae bacterium]|jgi:alpha-D-ribose 1-methylphosphonate 5-triphosphate synthase subunit PhnG|nr:phosphonate C-P lyase system protein PhnG [Oscillospiraceae bacterium]